MGKCTARYLFGSVAALVFVVIAAAVIVLELRVIYFCCSFYSPLKGFQAIHVRRYESFNMTPPFCLGRNINTLLTLYC